MRTFLAIFGAIALIAVLFVVGLFVYAGLRVAPVQAESAAYADESIAAIFSDWDAAELTRRAAPELLASADTATRARFMTSSKQQYGELLQPEAGAVCALASLVYTFAGEAAVAGCAAAVRFENGQALIRMSVVKRSGEWRIYGLFIDRIDGQAPAASPVPVERAPEPSKLLASSFEFSLAGRYVAWNVAAPAGVDFGLGEEKIRPLTKAEILSRIAKP